MEYAKKYEDTIVIDALPVGAPDFERIGFTAAQYRDMIETRHLRTKPDMMNTTMPNGNVIRIGYP